MSSAVFPSSASSTRRYSLSYAFNSSCMRIIVSSRSLRRADSLVPPDLRAALLGLLPVVLELAHLPFVLRANALVLFLEHRAELRGVAAAEHLRLHRLDRLLQIPLLSLLLEKLLRPRFEFRDGAHLIRLRLPPLLVQLQQRALVHEVLRSLVELLPQPLQLALVLPKERLLIEVLVHARGVLDELRPVRELQRRERLRERLQRRGYHRHHRGLAVTPQRVLEDARQLRVAVRHVRPRAVLRAIPHKQFSGQLKWVAIKC
eukprot:31062-Pelagococcus_subviridis.AAC.1